MKQIQCLILIIALSFLVVYSQDWKVNVAVNDLNVKNMDEDISEIISDRLRSELIKTNVFRVMERAEMDNVLKEQVFQKSGLCDESSCLVDMGQLLGVEKMIAGSIGQISSVFFTISLRIIDVGSGEIILTINEDFEGNIQGLVSTAVKRAAEKLAGIASNDIERASLAGLKGALYIRSTYDGASIELDGEYIAGKTPITLKGVPAGNHRIIVRKGDYYGAKDIKLAPDDVLKIDVQMNEGRGALKVFSIPEGSEVFIDGHRKNITPFKLDNLSSGEHQIHIVKRGFITYNGTVNITTGESQNISVTLEPASYVSINSNIEDASIEINNKTIGTGAVKMFEVPSGDVFIRVYRSGYEVAADTTNLDQGIIYSKHFELISKFGSLNINSEPRNVNVYLNEMMVGSTPYFNNKLKPGKYKLCLEGVGYNVIKEDLIIVKDEESIKNYHLERSKEWKDSVALSVANELAKKKKVFKWTRRILFGGLTIGFAASALKNNFDALEAIDNAERIKSDYNSKKEIFDGTQYSELYKKEISNAEDDIKSRNVAAIVSGISAVFFTISIPF